MINKAYKFRIYPNKEQQILINKTFGCVRFFFNRSLDDMNKYYEENKEFLNITPAQYKDEFEFLKEVDSYALCNAQRNRNQAFKNFFRGKSNFPNFKSKHNPVQSYTTSNVNNVIKIIDDKHIKLCKLDSLRVKFSRDVKGKIKSATITRRSSNKYYISILTEQDDPTKLEDNGIVIGIDLGLKSFAITSNGDKIDNPRFLKQLQDKLVREQRKLSHMKKGSHNFENQKVIVARIHEKIANQRNDFLQKLSTQLIKDNSIICLETLRIENMLKNHHLAKSISDASWSKFVSMLEYKARWYGRTISQIDTFFPSSQTCSHCGEKFPITRDLGVRDWICPNCGEYLDRDINASKNILNEGIKLLTSKT